MSFFMSRVVARGSDTLLAIAQDHRRAMNERRAALELIQERPNRS
jgi:hypothetical protein